ncbi:MAG TPA: hypothetical protein PK263_04405 [bacterium]|nr:hypothetical protein [bacterium]
MDNCFILLELNSDEDDERVIETAIRKKQAYWSQNAHTHPDPQVKRIAQMCLDNLSFLKKTMLDPQLRTEERKKAKEEIKKIKNAKLKEFNDDIELLSKGNSNEQAIKKLAVKYAKFYFSEHEIRETLRQLEIRSEVQHDSTQADGQGLDRSTIETISTNLNLLKKTSLYDFLGFHLDGAVQMPRLDQLLAKTKEMEKTLRDSGKTDAETSIANYLVGQCLEIFKSEKTRKRYDQALSDERSAPLLAMIDSVCDGGNIEIGQIFFLLEKGQNFGQDPTKVLRLIRSKATRRRIDCKILDNLSFDTPVRCSCNYVNPLFRDRCAKCGADLYHRCVKCQIVMPIDSLACSCGFSLKKVHNTLKTALETGQLDHFLELWDDKAYRSHPAFSFLAKEYDAVKKKLEKKREDEQEALHKYKTLMAALAKNDDLAILSAWDESLLQTHPDLERYLARIKQAHQPPDVDHINATHYGSYILVRWNLQDHINRYKVVWSNYSFQRSIQAEQQMSITRGEYEREGCRIENPATQDYYFVVYSVSQFRGEELVSPGKSEGCRAVIKCNAKVGIHYSIEFKGILRKTSAVLILNAMQSVKRLPEMVLVARQGKIIPMEIQGGTIIRRFSNMALSAGVQAEISFSLNGISSPARFRLFISDPAQNEFFELLPDALEKQKI